MEGSICPGGEEHRGATLNESTATGFNTQELDMGAMASNTRSNMIVIINVRWIPEQASLGGGACQGLPLLAHALESKPPVAWHFPLV